MSLSEREREILSLACLSNKQIARRLNISWKTVQKYFAVMNTKTGTKNRTSLLFKMIKDNVIKKIDIGFYDSNGVYHEDICEVNLYKENALTDAELIEIISAYAKTEQENKKLYDFIEFLKGRINDRK